MQDLVRFRAVFGAKLSKIDEFENILKKALGESDESRFTLEIMELRDLFQKFDSSDSKETKHNLAWSILYKIREIEWHFLESRAYGFILSDWNLRKPHDFLVDLYKKALSK